jgi:hypothetical protein
MTESYKDDDSLKKRSPDELPAIIYYLNPNLPAPNTIVLRGLVQFTQKYHTIVTESSGAVIVPKDVLNDVVAPSETDQLNVREASKIVLSKSIIPILN